MLDIAILGAGMAKAFIDALKTGGARMQVLATAEADKLATSLVTVARLLASGDIDAEEAAILVSMQKSASEAVLASLQGISAVTARRATQAALASVAGSVDAVIGIPLVGGLLKT